MATTAGFLAYVVELFAPWAPVETKRMFGGAGIYRDGRMLGLVADDQIYLKVNEVSRPAFEAQGCQPFMFVAKTGKGIAMSYWSMPAEALEDVEALKQWAGRAWSAAAKTKLAAKPPRKRALTAKAIAELPLKSAGKRAKTIKKR